MPNDDLISRSALANIIGDWFSEVNYNPETGHNTFNAALLEAGNEVVAAALDAIDKAPTVDAEPVRSGSWQWKDGAAYCTAHKGKMNPHVYGYGYCPNCGAKMDKEEDTPCTQQ